MTQGALALSGAHAPKAALGALGADVQHLPFPVLLPLPVRRGRRARRRAVRPRAALGADRHAQRDPAAGGDPRRAGAGRGRRAPGAGVVRARRARRRRREAGAVLVADEVQTGLGRTGTLWGSDAIGLDPDVLVLSKAIGGGQPLAVIVYRDELDVWEPGAHAGTFRGNQLALAAGAATIRHIVEHDLAEHAAALGERLLDGLRERTAGLPVVGDVRGRGLMVGVELVDPQRCDADGLPLPDGALASAVQRAMLDLGVLVEIGGREGAVVRFLPPLIIEAEHVDRDRRDLRQGGLERMAGDVTAVAVAAPPLFLGAEPAVARAAARARRRGRRRRRRPRTRTTGPFSGADPVGARGGDRGDRSVPGRGRRRSRTLLAQLGDDVLAHGVNVADPRCAAHLHCPTLLPAAAAELAIGATNQSLDSFDQAPAATLVEDHLVRWLAATLGFATGSGVLTSGGTASNLLGLLLARERACARVAGHGAGAGLPAQHARWRIVASRAAHDSVRRAAAVLGLGTDCRRRRRHRSRRADRRRGARRASWPRSPPPGDEPIAIVATAGTTDLGAIDPLAAIAERARACGAWLHVDAAVGSAFALSPRLAPLLAGIERADSITADLHKLWFMPIGASALLVRDVALLDAVHHHSDYLNRADDEADGVLNLVGRSLDTSRRFDALKILVGLRSTGRRRMAAMVEGLVDLARGGGARRRRARRARAARAAVDGDRRLSLAPAPASRSPPPRSTPSTSPRSARCCARAARSSGARAWTGASR